MKKDLKIVQVLNRKGSPISEGEESDILHQVQTQYGTLAEAIRRGLSFRYKKNNPRDKWVGPCGESRTHIKYPQ